MSNKNAAFFVFVITLVGFNYHLIAQNQSSVLTTEEYLNFESCASILAIHPQAADFTAGQEGKVMISTTWDDSYHTPFQVSDGEILISVELGPEDIGSTVYFRVVDPDVDDLSSYEPDDEGGDNMDANLPSGSFLGNSTTAVTAVDDGQGGAKAEAVLTITDRYAGDNYQVEASLNSDFTDVARTMILVAWKRIYLEIDRMYRFGSTLSAPYVESPDDDNQDFIFVNDASDFAGLPEGAILELFVPPFVDQDPVQVALVSTELPINRLLVDDPPGAFNFFPGAGVRIVTNESTYDVDLGLLGNGFGAQPDGTDGGTFMEFQELPMNASRLPKLVQYPSLNNLIAETLAWRPDEFNPQQGGDVTNYIQLVITNDYVADALYGTSQADLNLTVLFEDNHVNADNVSDTEKGMAETLVHEFGHQMGLYEGLFTVIHSLEAGHKDHDDMDEGVMSSARNRDNEIAEFALECINYMRSTLDRI